MKRSRLLRRLPALVAGNDVAGGLPAYAEWMPWECVVVLWILGAIHRYSAFEIDVIRVLGPRFLTLLKSSSFSLRRHHNGVAGSSSASSSSLASALLICSSVGRAKCSLRDATSSNFGARNALTLASWP